MTVPNRYCILAVKANEIAGIRKHSREAVNKNINISIEGQHSYRA